MVNGSVLYFPYLSSGNFATMLEKMLYKRKMQLSDEYKRKFFNRIETYPYRHEQKIPLHKNGRHIAGILFMENCTRRIHFPINIGVFVIIIKIFSSISTQGTFRLSLISWYLFFRVCLQALELILILFFLFTHHTVALLFGLLGAHCMHIMPSVVFCVSFFSLLPAAIHSICDSRNFIITRSRDESWRLKCIISSTYRSAHEIISTRAA